MKRLITSLVAGITLDDSEQDARQDALERAYRELRLLEFGAVLGRNPDGEFYVLAEPAHGQTPIRELLDAAESETNSAVLLDRLNDVFENGGIRSLLFLPGVALGEIEVALAIVRAGGEYLQLKLMERLVHRVAIVNTTPMLLVKRAVSDNVAGALDSVFLTMTGIDRVGCGDEHGPDHVLRTHGDALLRCLEAPEEIANFLSSLDLVLHSYPAEVQRGVLKLLAQSIPDSQRSACEHVLEVLRDTPQDNDGPRRGVIESVLSSMRGEDVLELAMARRPARVRRIEGDTQPGPTLPMAVPPPLLPVEEVAERSQSSLRLEMDEHLLPSDEKQAFASDEQSLPGIVLEPQAVPMVFSEGPESMSFEAMEDRVATYRERSSQLLTRASAATPSEFPQCVHSLTNVANHLFDAGEYADTWGILRFFLSEARLVQRTQDPASKKALEDAKASLLRVSRTQAMCDALPHAEFGEQAAILEILAVFGADAMPALLHLNASYYLGPIMRRSVFTVMETAGESGGDILADYLRANKTRLHRLTPLVEMLGALDRGRQRELLIAYARHLVPAVRKAALIGLYRSLGKDGEKIFMDALKDEDPSVCQTAITLLAASRCMSSDFLEWLHQVIMCPNPTDVREEGVVVAALRAVGLLGNVSLGASQQVEDALLDRIGVSKSGWLRRTPRLENDLSPRVQEAICSTLGFIGTDHSKQALNLFLNDGLPAVRRRAQEALDRIRQRGSMVY